MRTMPETTWIRVKGIQKALISVGLTLVLLFLAVQAIARPAMSLPYFTRPGEGTGLIAVAPAGVSWLEPKGLNIVDLVGFVPEEYLRGAIVYYSPGYGIIRYQSGVRLGDTVTITATVYPRYIKDVNTGWYGSLLGCLGQPARFDQWGSVTPPARMTLYNGATDITGEVGGYEYVPAAYSLPVGNAASFDRYAKIRVEPVQLSGGALEIPANMGCMMWIHWKNYRELTAVYVIQTRPVVSVTLMGTEVFTFHSYIGPGNAGLLSPLVSQLTAKYSNRHEKFDLHIPEGADYFFLNFPPMPVDPYTEFPGNPYDNVDRPVGGTYRIDGEGGLSVDHVNSMGLPLYGHWEDSDLAPGATYLPHYKQPYRLAAPEYFVPAGVNYNHCMVYGGCPDWLLEQIYNTEMTMRIVYLKVERISCRLNRIPLRMVGTGWSPGASSAFSPAIRSSLLSPTESYSYFVFLPLIFRDFCAAVPPDNPEGCPCGWFTEDGRMVDFIPQP